MTILRQWYRGEEEDVCVVCVLRVLCVCAITDN